MRDIRPELANYRNYIFGSTAAIITNISLIVGLGTAQNARGAILGGLLTIALADNISDSLGIHMYKEAEGTGPGLTWLATVLNFAARLAISASFIALVLLLPPGQASAAAVAWGLALLVVLSYLIARQNGVNPLKETAKHLAVAVAVIIASRLVGGWIASRF